jgi:hypothetical protein
MMESRHRDVCSGHHYHGILFYLLLLVAIDQWRETLAKVFSVLTIGVFAAYDLTSYANGLREYQYCERGLNP